MGIYVTDRSTAPVAAAASNNNCEPPKSSIDSSGLSTSILKEETRFYFPEDFDFFIKAVPERERERERQRECKQEEENNCHFDWYSTPLKCFKKLQTTYWSN
jgi:hypothetical protein